jgi:hypothetical protein
LSKLLFLVVFIFGTEIGFWFSWNWHDPAYKNRWSSKKMKINLYNSMSFEGFAKN